MSRCWDVANFCPLVVFVAGVRVVEFGSYYRPGPYPEMWSGGGGTTYLKNHRTGIVNLKKYLQSSRSGKSTELLRSAFS